MSKRYTLSLWRDDMGTFKQPGCRDIEDALWHINEAREHDGLHSIELGELNDALRQPRSDWWATMTPEE